MKGCFDGLKPDRDARYSDKWTVAEFANLQNGADLSLREFSRFLGFGEQTAARYEKGALPNLPIAIHWKWHTTQKGHLFF